MDRDSFSNIHMLPILIKELVLIIETTETPPPIIFLELQKYVVLVVATLIDTRWNEIHSDATTWSRDLF